MKNLRFLWIFVLILVTASCEKDKQTNLSNDKICGYVQKGPYLNGTSISISELTDGLNPNGKIFSSQITDNMGSFEINDMELTSQYVELKADGFYFNEVSNDNSSAQLTLYALSGLSDKSSLNVNILSNLEKERVKYLVSNGSSFSDAKKQAQSEILSIFEISKADMTESELLDITQPGEDNAILLAVSAILQGYLTVADLSELLANISTDISEDGILNSQNLGSALLNNAKIINLDNIRQNLESRYETIGMRVTVPDFGKYVNQFIDNTDFEFTAMIGYPANGIYGLNILDIVKTEYSPGIYSMIATLPEGTSLKVKVKGMNWSMPIDQVNTGWTYTDWNVSDTSRTFLSTRTGDLDYKIFIDSPRDNTESNNTKIFVYENGIAEATWTKEITVTE